MEQEQKTRRSGFIAASFLVAVAAIPAAFGIVRGAETGWRLGTGLVHEGVIAYIDKYLQTTGLDVSLKNQEQLRGKATPEQLAGMLYVCQIRRSQAEFDLDTIKQVFKGEPE